MAVAASCVLARSAALPGADKAGSFARQESERSAITVKNTFIEAFLIDEDSEDDGELPMVAARSCPAVRLPSCCSLASTTAGESSSEESPVSGGRPMARQRWADQCEGEDEVAEASKVLVAPLATRTPEVSVGSELHEMGQCKPCAWFWRPQGCDNGSACRHCHMCGEGELKARRKARASATRRSFRRGQGASFRA